jgi:hypothetical protein
MVIKLSMDDDEFLGEYEARDSITLMEVIELSMDWEEFLEEYKIRNSEIYEEEFPTLAQEIEFYKEEGSDARQLILDYVKKALTVEGIPIDKVMNDYIDCLLEISDFGFYDNEEVTKVVMYLLDKGARFPEEKVIAPNYRNYDESDDYFHEFWNYEVKGALIDCVADTIELPLLHAIDWVAVKAVYWDAVDKFELLGQMPTEEERCGFLNSDSAYLRNKYPCGE